MLDALTLDQIRIFITVADAGSFRAAAQKLQRVQSAISHSIFNLESQLNILLFDRSGHKPRLTPQGQMLLADCRAVILKVNKLRARARGISDGVEMGFAIAIDPQFPLELASAAFKDFHDRYPSVMLQVHTAPLGEAVLALREKRVTLAISGFDLEDPFIERLALTYLPRIAVVAPKHPLATSTSTSDLINQEILSEYIQIVATDPTSLTDGRDISVLSPNTWRVSDNAVKLSLIKSGVGWGNLPSWLVQEELDQRSLVRLPITDYGQNGESALRAYLMHRSDEYISTTVSFFIDSLLEHVHADCSL